MMAVPYQRPTQGERMGRCWSRSQYVIGSWRWRGHQFSSREEGKNVSVAVGLDE